MRWLSRLSFVQAFRWASLWPATVVAAAAVAWLAATARGAVVTVRVEPAEPYPLWVALALVASVVLFGPPVVFLAAWKVARR